LLRARVFLEEVPIYFFDERRSPKEPLYLSSSGFLKASVPLNNG